MNSNIPCSTENSLAFDKSTGNFIVNVKMTPEEYACFAQEQTVADLDKLVFNKDIGLFIVPVYMTPEEYSRYAQNDMLPSG